MEGPVQSMRCDLGAEGWEGSEKAERNLKDRLRRRLRE